MVCPTKLSAELRQNDIPGVGRVLVPGHPIALVVCRDGTRTEIADEDTVGSIAEQLNGIPRPGVDCYMSRPIGLFFDYEDGGVLLVAVQTPCGLATNGTTTLVLDRETAKMVSALSQGPGS